MDIGSISFSVERLYLLCDGNNTVSNIPLGADDDDDDVAVLLVVVVAAFIVRRC